MTFTPSVHGTAKGRGCSHAKLGNFGFMTRHGNKYLPSWASEFGICSQSEAQTIAAILGGVGGVMHDTGGQSRDIELPAAYTFFAQFVDHDITLDTGSQLHRNELNNEEVEKLGNLRTPSLDLDCVYGFGPEASPYLYDHRQEGRLLVGSEVDGVSNPEDLPRNSEGRALIGDPRNDENLFVSQMQLMFLKFHNRMLSRHGNFETAQRETRFHYQWVVLNDFLQQVCEPEIYKFAKKLIEREAKSQQGKHFPLTEIRSEHGLVMPVEFSVAAYRFGHSLVRSSYPVNADHPHIELFDERFGTEGFSPVPKSLVVDWNLLLDLERCSPYAKCRAIDHFLADELIHLPDPVVGRNAPADDRSLAFRNLLRGYVMGLPSGQQVAEFLDAKGYPGIDPKATLGIESLEHPKLTSELAKKLGKSTPLFFYLMREAGTKGGGETLGPVGSAILMEVFGAMLSSCETFLSYQENDEPWKPDECVTFDGYLTLKDIAHFAG